MFKELIKQPNGWIEASAGTGKTYTIQQMVLEIIRTGKGAINEILMVTFTEKAAGEMRDRIRQILFESLRTGELSSDEVSRLRVAIKNFDTAEIYTIHGWCKKVLQKIPFESGRSFQERLTDEAELFDVEFAEFLKSDWFLENPELLQGALDNKYISLADIQKSKLLEIAKKFSLLDSFESDNYTDTVERIIQRFIGAIGGDVELFIENFIAAQLKVYKEYPKHCAKSKVFEPWLTNFLGAFPAILRACVTGNSFVALFDHIRSFSRGQEKVDYFSKKIKKSDEIDLDDSKVFLIPQGLTYSLVVELFSKLLSDAEEYVKFSEMGRFIPLIKNPIERVQKIKDRQSLFTFNDMISRVSEIVVSDTQNGGGSQVAARIAAQYSYVLVDEFQDTDTAQWDIFKTLFLTNNKSKLFLIGDPKQAIYSFRGADIDTYFRAREEMLQVSGKGVITVLGENYRSSERIIEAYNVLFQQEAFFGGAPEQNDALESLRYTPVVFPGENSPAQAKNSFFMKRGLSPNYNPLVIKNIEGGTLSECRSEYYPWMINALIDLKNQGCAWGDICILVEKRPHIDEFEYLLKEKNIPYSYYKQKGIYQSNECAHIEYLLQSILSGKPQDVTKALLTPFFKCQLEEVQVFLSDTSVIELYEKWRVMVEQQRWGALYDSFLIDTGVVERIAQLPDSYKRLDSYKQIMQDLQSEAYGKKLTLSAQVDIIKNWSSKRIEQEDDGEYFRKEREDSAVQIMTMHASKGLEFNVVFIGGFGTVRVDEFVTKKNGSGHSFDFTEKQSAQEKLPEYRRLLYVALTRAKYFVYLPKLNNAQDKTGRVIGSKVVLTEALTQAENNLSGLCTIDPLFDGVLQRECEGEPGAQKMNNSESRIPQYEGFAKKKIIMESYSHLSHNLNDAERSVSEIGRVELPYAPALYNKYIQDIPRGAEPGNCLHEIFENIDFEIVNGILESEDPGVFLITHPKVGDVIRESCIRYGISKRYYRAIGDLIYNTLKTKMVDAYNTEERVILSEIDTVDLKAEMEFQFSYAKTNRVELFPQGEDANFVKGFIDLLFRKNGRYYILDWKSNYLDDGYNAAAIEASMIKDHYDIQLKVYSLALHQWLKTALPGYDYDRHFGGVYYVYVRGMQVNAHEGYVAMRPLSANQIDEEYASEIKELIAGSHVEAHYG